MTNNRSPQVTAKGGKGGKGSKAPIKAYDEFEPLIQLHGNSYKPVKKATFYSIIGAVICDNKINFCGKIMDTRINLFFPLKSGSGKSDIKDVMKRSIKQLKMEYCEPTSLHPEQLIGKTIEDPASKKVIINKGHLADDYLVFEESTDLFTDKDNQEIRNYIKISLDPIGTNEITKRSVDTLKQNSVRYSPKCTAVFFFQPLKMREEIATRGLLRRGLIIYVDPDINERYEALNESIVPSNLNSNWKNWISFLNKLKATKFKWKFTDEAVKEIIKLTKQLSQIGMNKGNKAAGYTQIALFNLKEWLVKMSCIQAAIDCRDKISISDVTNAYKDLSVFWDIQLTFVIHKISGYIDYKDTNMEEIRILSILQSNNCLSEVQSNLMIRDFIKYISKELGVSEDTARNKYQKLKNTGYIDSKQVGRNGSKVWLTDEGERVIEPNKTLTTLHTLDKKPSLLDRLRRKSKTAKG